MHSRKLYIEFHPESSSKLRIILNVLIAQKAASICAHVLLFVLLQFFTTKDEISNAKSPVPEY